MRRPEDFIPTDHPLRPFQAIVNEVSRRMTACSPACESPASMADGSIAPEKLLRAMLLQMFFSVRLECHSWSRTNTTSRIANSLA